MNKTRLVVLLFTSVSLAFSQADNTKKNKRDRSEQAVTADQQAENKEDRELTRKIRKSLTDDKSLSTYAKNIKIVSRGGNVTLRGPVNTEEEKQKVASVAASIAGAAKVSNEIEVVKKSKESEHE